MIDVPGYSWEFQEEEAEFAEKFFNWYNKLQPTEKKRVLDQLADLLYETGFECTFCGRKISGKDVVFLTNLPVCKRCDAYLHSPVVKMRLANTRKIRR